MSKKPWLREKPQIFTEMKKVRSLQLQNTGKGKFWLQRNSEDGEYV